MIEVIVAKLLIPFRRVGAVQPRTLNAVRRLEGTANRTSRAHSVGTLQNFTDWSYISTGE